MFIMMFPGVFIVHFLNNGNSLSFFMYRNEPGTAIRLDSILRFVMAYGNIYIMVLKRMVLWTTDDAVNRKCIKWMTTTLSNGCP